MNDQINILKINELWESLIRSDKELIIATVVTKNVSKNWCFFFRNKIIRLLAPPNIKILSLEFDKKNCEQISKNSENKDGYLTIHGVMINNLIKIINEESYCLLIDIDAFPISQNAIKIAFATAFLKGVNGNIQRTNCLDNNQHIFIAESFMCFYTKKIKSIGERAWKANQRSDVSEELSWEWPELIDENVFVPIKTIMKPIWPLEGNKPRYGIGTTFAFNNIKISYHHFFGRNIISQIHFLIVSLSFYLKLKSARPILKKISRHNFNFLLSELKFSIKYILGRIL